MNLRAPFRPAHILRNRCHPLLAKGLAIRTACGSDALSLSTPMMKRLILPCLFALSLSACHSGVPDNAAPDTMPGDSASHQPYEGIGVAETVHFSGTEPFWGGQVKGMVLTYTTPQKPDGQTLTVERFAGRNGLSYSGSLGGKSFIMAVTPGECSDGMSDRTYPFTVTLEIDGVTRNGCAWSDTHEFRGPPEP